MMEVARQELGRSTLSKVTTLAVCLLAVYVTTNLLQEPRLNEAKSLVRDETTKQRLKPISLGKPPALINYAEFRRRLMKGPTPAASEHSLRLLHFNGNLIEIGQHNLATLTGYETYFIGQSPLRSDLTPSEQDQLGFNPSELSGPLLVESGLTDLNELDKPVGGGLHLNKLLNLGRKKIKYTLDADQTGCLGEAKNQGDCGSCYAFSLMSLVEWHYCKQSGEIADFSEQYLLDCGPKINKEGMRGCKETRLPIAKDFILFHGIKWEKDYPYRGNSDKSRCSDEMIESKLKLKVAKWRYIPVDREIFEKTLLEQPIIMETHLPSDIGSYSGGIHSGKNCVEHKRHGMLLVGYGTQDGRPFWLVRNTYGKNWGSEGGYLRISRDMPDMEKCFAFAWVSRFEFPSLPEDAYTDFYENLKNDPPAVPKRAAKATGLLANLIYVTERSAARADEPK